MADEFRKIQKQCCEDGGNARGHNARYGCPCCRKIRNLNQHKKWARKKSRRVLKDLDRKFTFR